MTAKRSRRILAFIVDMLIVVTISTLITSFIPVSEKANEYYRKLEDLTSGITEKPIDLNNYINEVNSLTYDINHETVIEGIINVIIYLLYFVVLPLYNKGQTFGKKLLMIRIKDNSDGSLEVNNLLIRSLVLYNIWIKILLIIFIVFLDKQVYIRISNYSEYIQIIIMVTIVLMVLFRKDKRGLHDLIAKTKVIEE